MYCVKCGVKLADTEKKCPLCDTVVCHPDIKAGEGEPLYPPNKMPSSHSGTKALCGAIIFLFMIPLSICFFADYQYNGEIDWYGYVAGALGLFYVIFALPIWFKKPHPIIFCPCDFAALALFLMYVSYQTNGGWFLTFALPITVALAIIVCAAVTLLTCLRRGKLYIIGGIFMAFGSLITLVEHLMSVTFSMRFVGWSIYPLIAFFLIGGLMIYLAIDSTAREALERKLFF